MTPVLVHILFGFRKGSTKYAFSLLLNSCTSRTDWIVRTIDTGKSYAH